MDNAEKAGWVVAALLLKVLELNVWHALGVPVLWALGVLAVVMVANIAFSRSIRRRQAQLIRAAWEKILTEKRSER